MDEHTRLALITTGCAFAVILILILLFIVWKCCYKDGRFMSPSQKHKESSQERLLFPGGSRKTDFLVKRCDQESTRGIENHILEKLKGNCYVFERPWVQALDDGQRPVMVFCVNSSRIGTDIENAMRGVNDTSNIILVLLHCVLKSLLGNRDLSDEQELLDTSMRNRMEGIVHFAFSDREGLYSCHQNKEGHVKLAALVKSLTK